MTENPLRERRTVADKNGKLHVLSMELADFSMASREIGVKLMPFGATEFWATIDADPYYSNLVLLYVALRRSSRPKSLDDLIEWFPTEALLGPVREALEKTLEDFSQRLASMVAPVVEAQEPGLVNGTYGQSVSLISDFPRSSFGA